MGAIIEVNNLSKQFGNIKAVDDLSFTVNEGDVYGFLGQNGAGKSTTIRMLLTLVKPDAGEIRIFGKSLATKRHEILRQTGALIERPDLYKFLSAYDNLSIFARLSGLKLSRKELMERLAMVGLETRYNSKVKTFSQGMKQRLGIAVALVHDPRLVILDEPVNGLDPQGIAEIRNLILELSRQRGKTILISSHLLSEIEMVANRLVIIHKGKKMAEGDLASMSDPGHALVLLETSDNDLAIHQLSADGWPVQKRAGGKFIEVKLQKTEIPLLVTALTAKNIGLISLKSQHSLEEFFISLTNDEGHVDAVAN